MCVLLLSIISIVLLCIYLEEAVVFNLSTAMISGLFHLSLLAILLIILLWCRDKTFCFFKFIRIINVMFVSFF